jgi:uncharacterized membrane protein YdjX (TVP38/TMEM64 family)
VLLWAFDVQEALGLFLRWIDGLGWAGIPLFFCLHTLAIVVLFPGILFPLGAGFLFGPIWGTVISTLGKTAGAAVAFVIARYVLDESPAAAVGVAAPRRAQRIAEFKQRHPKLRLLDRHLPEGGWRMVALIRLVPVIPFKLSNYFFGWSRFRRRDYLLGTLLGCIPYSFTNAWLGSLAADLSTLTTDPVPRGPLEWALTGAGLGLALVAALLITRRARGILAATHSEDSLVEPAVHTVPPKR